MCNKACCAVSMVLAIGVGLGASRDIPLIEAAKRADAAAVAGLLQQHVDVNVPESDGTTALHWAAHRGDLNTLEQLLHAGATADSANRYGITPLWLACVNGDAASVARLLDAGADPNRATPEGETPLMVAARTGRVEALKVLLDHGARVNEKENWRSQTALMWAAAENHSDAVELLLAAGADIHARTSGPVLSAAASGPAAFAGVVPGLPTPTSEGFTAFTFAIRAGHAETVSVLLQAGANANETVADGTSALVLAIINGRYDLAAVLLDHGADPNADAQGWSALHQLVFTSRPNYSRGIPNIIPTGKMDRLELAKALLAHGANPNARQKKEPSVAIGMMRNMLKRSGATPFLLAAKAADADMMRVLAAHGADPSLTTDEGATPLMAAAGIGLFNLGESVGTNDEAFEAVKAAWELGGDVNAADVNGDTALHGAALRGSDAIVKFLVAKGAKLDAANKKGLTPLNVADGIEYTGSLKSAPETAALIRTLLSAR